MKKEGSETYYEVLKIPRGATVPEIVTAYHSAKSAFSRDSVATYSLFNPEEIQEELSRLEAAYLTLSNLDRRALYDRSLETGQALPEPEPSLTRPPEPQRSNPYEKSMEVNSTDRMGGVSTDNLAPVTELTGAILKSVREKRGLSIEDVARITKIPSKFITNIEAEDGPKLPARVYIQGFIKNIAVLYRIDPKTAASVYLAYISPKLPPEEG